MGIFSLFGKKDRRQPNSASGLSARPKQVITDPAADEERNKYTNLLRQNAQAARETAKKIDAIEYEMSSEFIQSTTIQPGASLSPTASVPPTSAPPPLQTPRPAQSAQPTAITKVPAVQPKPEAAPKKVEAQDTLSPDALTNGSFTEIRAEAASLIEEAAILFANNQIAVVESMLQSAIAEDALGNSTLYTWEMLFDLYRITDKQLEFENLSIEYANKFETSPPTWVPLTPQKQAQPARSMQMVQFSEKLDSNSAKLIAHIQKLAESHRTIRIEFSQITEVTPDGCALLLHVLNKLQKSNHDLLLAGAAELADKIAAIVQVARRDNTESAWLLLLEILRLLNREKEFEEISIDYCITFEVSPPMFVRPKNSVITTDTESIEARTDKGTFTMPPVVEGNVNPLLSALTAYYEKHSPAIIDCSQLTRVDFYAAGRLLTGLAPAFKQGRRLEFHHVNYLVAGLFNVLGFKDIGQVITRKH